MANVCESFSLLVKYGLNLVPNPSPKSLQMVIVAMKLKDAYSLEGELWPT